jgi:two-component system, cell cycle sensor histidine kinase and response regulator CckA
MKDGGGSSAAGKPDTSVLFRALFMHMAEGVALHEITVDGAGRPAGYRILEVNPQYEQFMGMPRDQLIGKLASEVFGPGDPRGAEVYGQAVFDDRPSRVETHCPYTGRHFDVSVAPMGSGFFATIMVDVTERKLHEKALREGEWFLQRSQRVGRLGSYRLDVASAMWVGSQGLDDVFGIDATFVRNVAGWVKLLHPDDRDVMTRYFADDVLGKRKAFDRRYRIVRHNDGEVRWVHGRGELELDAGGAPVTMIGTIQDITEAVQREHALRSKSDELDRIFSLTLDMLCIAGRDGHLLRVNAAWERVLGWPIGDLEGSLLLSFVHDDDVATTSEAIRELASGKDLIDFTNRCRCKDGTHRFIEWRAVLTGGVIYAAARDVSDRQKSQAERQRLEQQLLQSQKMESVGLLAGGVAHDFNNLLTVILGCADVLGRRAEPADAEHQSLLSEITSAAQRAADLTRQLLAFSRRQVLQPRVLDLNNVVADVSRMLGRMLGEDVKIERLLGSQVGAVFADPGQLHQIIVNLAVNARDAMPKGGTLTLETTDVPAAEAAGLVDPAPGAYVALIVRDTGLGMDEATRGRIFEPFFTTKGEMGTGLGLATVYGIVKQSGGQILVSSEPGRGTTFKLFLPRAQPGSAASAPSRAGQHAGSLAGRETVLLVEDEALVRAVLKKVLVRAGYSVLEAANAEDASLVNDRFDGTIHALVTDVVMPGKTGLELARHLTTVRPALKVLYMSGYAPNAPQLAFGVDNGVSFLQKPITPPQLLSMLRDVLDRPR